MAPKLDTCSVLKLGLSKFFFLYPVTFTIDDSLKEYISGPVYRIVAFENGAFQVKSLWATDISANSNPKEGESFVMKFFFKKGGIYRVFQVPVGRNYIIDEDEKVTGFNPNLWQLRHLEALDFSSVKEYLDTYFVAVGRGVVEVVKFLKDPKMYSEQYKKYQLSMSSSSTGNKGNPPSRTQSGGKAAKGGDSDDSDGKESDGILSMSEDDGRGDLDESGKESRVVIQGGEKGLNDSSRQKIRIERMPIVKAAKAEPKKQGKGTKKKKDEDDEDQMDEEDVRQLEENHALVEKMTALALDLFTLTQGPNDARKLVVAIPITDLKQFPEKTEDCSDKWLWKNRTRPIFESRVETLTDSKKKRKVMGAYAPAVVVNPNIRTIEHLKRVLKKIESRLPLDDSERFYLTGNNHNHLSSLNVLKYAENNHWPEKDKQQFLYLDCIPMVYPSGNHGGFDFSNDDNRITIIRKIGTQHNLDTHNVHKTNDIEAACQCIDHCLGFRDPDRGGSREKYLAEINRSNAKDNRGINTSLRSSCSSSYMEVASKKQEEGGAIVRYDYSQEAKWCNCFMRKERAEPEGIEELQCKREYLTRYMALDLPGQEGLKKTYQALKDKGHYERAETFRRDNSNFHYANTFAEYNQVPINLRLQCLKRILRKKDAVFSKSYKEEAYTVRVFIDEIKDIYFNQFFMKTYEKALCEPYTFAHTKQHFPNIHSCLFVSKAPKAKGTVGRQPKNPQATEYGVNMKKLYALAAGPKNKEKPEIERIKIGQDWFNHGEPWQTFFKAVRGATTKRSIPKSPLLASSGYMVSFNHDLERQIMIEDTEVFGDSKGGNVDLEGKMKEIKIGDCVQIFEKQFEVPVIEYFKLLPLTNTHQKKTSEEEKIVVEDAEKKRIRKFEAVCRIEKVWVIGYYGDLNGMKNEGRSALIKGIKAIKFDVPFGKDTSLPYDSKPYTAAELELFFKNEGWQNLLLTSNGQCVTMHICCSEEQLEPFEKMLNRQPTVLEVKRSYWIKTHKNGTIAIGGQGNASLSNNVEYGLDVYLGPTGSTVKPDHFPFFTSSDNKYRIALMNRLRNQAFLCPFATDLEKFRHPGIVERKTPLNIYDKGTHFNDFMVNRMAKRGEWVLSGFAGSNGFAEMCVLNGCHVVFVEKDQEQYFYGCQRIKDLKLKFDILKRPFEFDIGLMHIQAGDEDLPECDAKYMVPAFSVDFREPSASEEPWSDLKMCKGEHERAERNAKQSWKNFAPIRNLFGMTKWFAEAMDTFKIGVPKMQTTLDGWLESKKGESGEGKEEVNEAKQKKEAKKRKREEEDDEEYEPSKKKTKKSDGGKGIKVDGKVSKIPAPPKKAPVPNNKFVIHPKHYDMEEFKNKDVFKDVQILKTMLLPNIKTTQCYFPESWALLKKKSGADVTYSLIIKLNGEWMKVNKMVSFSLLPFVSSTFIRHRLIEKKETPFTFDSSPFRPIAVCRVPIEESVEEDIRVAVETKEAEMQLDDGLYFAKFTRLIILPLELHEDVEGVMIESEVEELVKKLEVNDYFLDPYPFETLRRECLKMLNFLDNTQISFRELLYLEALKEKKQVIFSSVIFENVGKLEGEEKEEWESTIEEAKEVHAYIPYVDQESVICFRGFFDLLKAYICKLRMVSESVYVFQKYDDHSDLVPDDLFMPSYASVTTTLIDDLFNPPVMLNPMFRRKLRTLQDFPDICEESKEILYKMIKPTSVPVLNKQSLTELLDKAKDVVKTQREENENKEKMKEDFEIDNEGDQNDQE